MSVWSLLRKAVLALNTVLARCWCIRFVKFNCAMLNLLKLTSTKYYMVVWNSCDGWFSSSLNITLHPLVIHAIVQKPRRCLTSWTINSEAQLQIQMRALVQFNMANFRHPILGTQIIFSAVFWLFLIKSSKFWKKTLFILYLSLNIVLLKFYLYLYILLIVNLNFMYRWSCFLLFYKRVVFCCFLLCFGNCSTTNIGL